MKVVEFIEEQGLEILKTMGIDKVEQDDKVLLDYNLFNANPTSAIVKECRGLILQKNTWRVICRSFDRFFNIQETCADKIHWPSAYALEKIDGSLTRIYWDEFNNRWSVATRRSIYANGPIGQFSGFTNPTTFAEIFWETLGLSDAYLNKVLDKDMTYSFELVSPLNQIVVHYPINKLYLINVRNNILGQEFPISWLENIAKKLSVSLPRILTFSNEVANKEKLNNFVHTLDGKSHEGLVVVDKYFNRVKIKNANYCSLHKVMGNMGNPKTIIDLVLEKKADDIVSLFPYLKNEVNKYKSALLYLYTTCLSDYRRIGKIRNQKDFATETKKCEFPSILFLMKKGKSIEESFLSLLPVVKYRLLQEIVKKESNEK